MKNGHPKKTVYVSFAPGDEAVAEEFISHMTRPDIVEDIFHSQHFFWYRADNNEMMSHLRIADSSVIILLYTERTNGNWRVRDDMAEALEYVKPVFGCFLCDTPMSDEFVGVLNAEDQFAHTQILTREEVFNQIASYKVWRTVMG